MQQSLQAVQCWNASYIELPMLINFVKLSKAMVGHRFMSAVAAKVKLTLAASSEDSGCVMAAVFMLPHPKMIKTFHSQRYLRQRAPLFIHDQQQKAI